MRRAQTTATTKPDWQGVKALDPRPIVAYWEALSHDERLAIALHASRMGLSAPKQARTNQALLSESACQAIEKANRVIIALEGFNWEELAINDARFSFREFLQKELLVTYTSCVDLLQPALWVVNATRQHNEEVRSLLNLGWVKEKP